MRQIDVIHNDLRSIPFSGVLDAPLLFSLFAIDSLTIGAAFLFGVCPLTQSSAVDTDTESPNLLRADVPSCPGRGFHTALQTCHSVMQVPAQRFDRDFPKDTPIHLFMRLLIRSVACKQFLGDIGVDSFETVEIPAQLGHDLVPQDVVAKGFFLVFDGCQVFAGDNVDQITVIHLAEQRIGVLVCARTGARHQHLPVKRRDPGAVHADVADVFEPLTDTVHCRAVLTGIGLFLSDTIRQILATVLGELEEIRHLASPAASRLVDPLIDLRIGFIRVDEAGLSCITLIPYITIRSRLYLHPDRPGPSASEDGVSPSHLLPCGIVVAPSDVLSAWHRVALWRFLRHSSQPSIETKVQLRPFLIALTFV